MFSKLPSIFLARHGETEWSLTGQHTGTTDLPLTEAGEENAARLGIRLDGITFKQVFTSPLLRARRTCELSGYGEYAQLDADLVEWNYGDYEGRRTNEIHAERPGWLLFRDGCPGGEMPADVAARADRVIGRLRRLKDDVLLFSSGHFLRTLAARWLNLPPLAGSSFLLNTASLSILGYDHDFDEPAIRLWNGEGHVVNPAMPQI
jgi:broad specificity phosphatase PhoE